MSKTTLDELFAKALTGIPAHEFKQAILGWHNKQVEEVLDRLESKEREYLSIYSDEDDFNQVVSYAVPKSAIEAERNKLKE